MSAPGVSDAHVLQGDTLRPAGGHPSASARRSTVRALAAILIAIHGAIHLIGFVVPWRLATLEGFAYRTTILDGAVDIGGPGARLLGIAWLGLALGFGLAAYGIWRHKGWGVYLVGALGTLSLTVCVLGLPETFAGVALNVMLLAGVAAYAAHAHRSRSQGVR